MAHAGAGDEVMLDAVSNRAITAQPAFLESEIWTAGEDGIESFYIYGLAAAGQTIFAFAEARIERHDKSPHHLVLKRSTDYGASWSKNHYLVVNQNGECFCNPTPLVDSHSGKIHLFYAQNFDNEASEIFVISSSDNGESWSVPGKITNLFEYNEHQWTLHLPGPGHGLRLTNGRQVLQIWHRRSLSFQAAERNYGISIIFSDDGGTCWQAGGTIPLGNAQLNESRIVELADGSLLLNARSGAFVISPRFFSRSTDQGMTWSEPQSAESLPPAFATDSGFANLQQEHRNLLILTRPAAVDSRKDLTVYLSRDEGSSWERSKTIYAGATGYSDAVVLPDGSFGVIYGKDLLEAQGDAEGNVKSTMFARFSLDWLADKGN